MNPQYKIIIDGQDITNIINSEERSLLESLSITDRMSNQSDALDFTLTYDGSFRIPPTRGKIEISIGYDPVIPRNPEIEYGIWLVGVFIVEGINFNASKSGGKVLQINSTSLPQSPNSAIKSLQNSNTRFWQSFEKKGTTFADIVNEVCNGANLKADIHAELSGIKMPFTAQVNQTDAQFLTKISSIRDGVVKYNDDQVIIALKDKTSLKKIQIDGSRQDILSYSYATSTRNDIRSVDAEYIDDNNKMVTVNIGGGGEPKYIIKDTQPDKDTAENAAKALLAHAHRNQIIVSISIATHPNLRAESPLELIGFDEPEVNGEYIVEEVRHQLNKSEGLTSVITAKREAEV